MPCTVRVSGVPEERLPEESALDYVKRLARSKAEAVSRQAHEIVLGADTVVVLEGHVLEKPVDHEDARRMLELLSGREHSVITGICLRHPSGSISDHAETRVRFDVMSPAEIADYVATGEPLDKAGAYAIQGVASKHISRIEGCYFNVVGLPVSLVYRHLKNL